MFKKALLTLAISVLLSTPCHAEDYYIASNDQGHWYLQTETVKQQKTNVNTWITYWTKTVNDSGYVRIETTVLVSRSSSPMYRFSFYQFYNNDNELIEQYPGKEQWSELYPNTLGYSIANQAVKILTGEN